MKTNYIPRPADTSSVELPPELAALSEELARNVHEVWAAGRIAEGWRPGPGRDRRAKIHECLVPYDELDETEKDYDRRTSAETLKFILSRGFTITKLK